MRSLALLFILFAAACSEGHLHDTDVVTLETDDEDTNITEPPATRCRSEVAWVQPEPGSVNVGVDQPFTIGLTHPLPDRAPWNLSVTNAKGMASLASDRRVLTWTPERLLEYSADYTVDIDLCGKATEVDFRTRGKPIDPSDLVGGRWSVRPNEAQWLAPSVASVFVGAVEFGSVSFFVDEGPRDWHLFGTVSLPSAYGFESCDEIIDMGPLDLTENPAFSTPPTSIDLTVEDNLVHIAHTQISGVFVDGTTEIMEFTLRGRVDVRPIEDLAEGLIDLCDMARLAGDHCVPCPDGVEACLFTVLTIDQVDGRPSRRDPDECDR